MNSMTTNRIIDENGIFDIADQSVLALIAGGLGGGAEVLDNHCVTNDSKCGKTAPSPSES